VVDPELCSECDRCIGCGLCVPSCPSEAVRFAAKPSDTVPPKDPSGDELS
jgi:ferredoxin